MQFRLTYEGPLYSTQPDDNGGRGDRRADHKHLLRRAFHRQLKRLWEVNEALYALDHSRGHFFIDDYSASVAPAVTKAELANENAHFGFNFVPLVTLGLNVLCGIDVLFLRPDKPGGVVWAGDLDNRLKTLLDALKIPDPGERYTSRTPEQDETPFFVLLQDDKLISKVAIEADELLDPISTGAGSESDVRLVITVSIRPYDFSPFNRHFS